ncbi:MAG TPA: divalent metal cation transporter [Marmoricola sp.]|nr:divalent metal cation transporter [Marmoricola sp.]
MTTSASGAASGAAARVAGGAGAPRGNLRRRSRAMLPLAVLGPGLLAGLSDDDPAGITTYSVLGADHGYRLLWVLLASTVALIAFHLLGSRLGVVTGQGLIGLVRHRYGVRVSFAVLSALVIANVGTAAAEYAGIAAAAELLGLGKSLAVAVAAVGVTALVLLGSFHRVEHLLLMLSAVFLAYVGAGFLAHPDWSAAFTGLVVPRLSLDHAETVIVAATVGTTLAPWGLSFIQSYAVDKKLTTADLRFERIDVVLGATLTGVIGFFVVVASAATLYASGVHIESATQAARALVPLAGHLAGTLFALGLIGAALLAAAVVPLSTAYSICDLTGSEAALDSRFADAKLFYLSDIAVTAVAAGLVLLPGVPLIDILVLTQTLNAILLVPLLVVMLRMARDRHLLGVFVVGRGTYAVLLVAFVGVVASVLLLLV